jgi:hypothetical protein
MIPDFDENGSLPPGVHPANLDDIEARFGQESELRRVQMQSLRWLIDLANRAGVKRLVINGSFVTSTPEPNDVDCVLLIFADDPQDSAALEEISDGLPFLDVPVVEQVDFAMLVDRFFATDRSGMPKGIVEVII